MVRRRNPYSEWLVSAILAVAIGCGGPAFAEESEEGLRRLAFELVNESRKEHGLAPLRLEAELGEAAQAHADDMVARHYFSHESPEGGTVRERYRAAGGPAGKLVAENIAECRRCEPGRETVEKLHQGWMESPGHRANLLSTGLERFGFGIAAEGDRVAAVQTFAGVGSSPGAAASAEPALPDPVDQLSVAIELVNEARERAGRKPLQSSPALSEALRRAGSAVPLASPVLRLPPLASVLSSLPGEERARLRAAALVAGQCGGCGAQPTRADIRFFVERWLGDPGHRARLLDPRWSDLGFALKADGGGAKRALAVLAGP